MGRRTWGSPRQEGHPQRPAATWGGPVVHRPGPGWQVLGVSPRKCPILAVCSRGLGWGDTPTRQCLSSLHKAQICRPTALAHGGLLLGPVSPWECSWQCQGCRRRRQALGGAVSGHTVPTPPRDGVAWRRQNGSRAEALDVPPTEPGSLAVDPAGQQGIWAAGGHGYPGTEQAVGRACLSGQYWEGSLCQLLAPKEWGGEPKVANCPLSSHTSSGARGCPVPDGRGPWQGSLVINEMNTGSRGPWLGALDATHPLLPSQLADRPPRTGVRP